MLKSTIGRIKPKWISYILTIEVRDKGKVAETINIAEKEMLAAVSGGGGGSRPLYKPTISVESALTGGESADLCHIDVEAEGRKFRRRRRATLLAILAIFLTTGIILIFSVVHDLQNRPEVGFVEEICSEADTACILNQCPHGYQWNTKQEKCFLQPGFECCLVQLSGQYLKHCWEGEEPDQPCAVMTAGIVLSTYKQLCRPGYLWVEWKKKCLRLDTGKI